MRNYKLINLLKIYYFVKKKRLKISSALNYFKVEFAIYIRKYLIIY